MRIIDISLPLSEDLPVWPGDPQVSVQRVRKIEEGANSNVSYLQMRVHSGTHVDAPVHFLPGKPPIDQVALQDWIGFVYVADMGEDLSVIDRTSLEKTYLPPNANRILFKTRNSKLWSEGVKEFREDFVGISQDGAEFLVERGFKLVGIDYLSISPYKKSRPTHEVLLNGGVRILEGLDLSRVGEGFYTLFCLPLNLVGSDGAPARAVLIDEM